MYLGNYPHNLYQVTVVKTARNHAKDFYKHINSVNSQMITRTYTKWTEENQVEVEKFNQELQKKFDIINKQHKKK